MDQNAESNVQRVQNNIGTLAEMSLMFYRSTLGAGASVEEATNLTQAYIGAILFGKPKGSAGGK